jgi:hypothetical protein
VARGEPIGRILLLCGSAALVVLGGCSSPGDGLRRELAGLRSQRAALDGTIGRWRQAAAQAREAETNAARLAECRRDEVSVHAEVKLGLAELRNAR